MQVAGLSCAVCSKPIVLASEGASCGACHTRLHRSCLLGEQPRCPACSRAFIDESEVRFVSDRCPNCGRRNRQHCVLCPSCAASLLFDSCEALHAEQTRIWQLGIRYAIHSCLGFIVVALQGYTAHLLWRGMPLVPYFSLFAIAALAIGVTVVVLYAWRMSWRAWVCFRFSASNASPG
jgi:hypothetical protein